MLFADSCQNCGHVIATHEYSFSYDDETQVSILSSFILLTTVSSLQEYSMECDLCGHGMDTVDIIPDENF